MALPANWRAVYQEAGGAKLSQAAAREVQSRLTRWPYIAAAHNFGRVLCQLQRPHFHGQVDADGVLRCMLYKGDYVRVWRSDLEGMQWLLTLAAQSTHENKAAGFRSTYPEGGGTRTHDGSLAGIWDYLNPFAPLFKPTQEAQDAYQAIKLRWASYETIAHVPAPPWDFLKPQHDAWIAFRDAWEDGEPDTTALEAMSADADVVRRSLAAKDPQWGDPNSGAGVKTPDVVDTTPALQAAQSTSDTAKAATDAAKGAGLDLWATIPTSVKLGAGGLAALLVLLGLRR